MSNNQSIYPTQNMHYGVVSSANYSNITLSNPTITLGNITSSNSGLHVSANSSFDNDVEINGNLKVKGTDLLQLLEGIQSRLNILIPDPEKLEHYESLKKAYAHYKMLEALCEKKVKE